MTEHRRQLLDRTLFPEEHVLAEGRANWLRPVGMPSGGSTHHYLWLTDQRLVWGTIWGTHGPWTLPLDALTSFEERTFDGHRYLLTLRQPRVETTFAFSRRDTGLARALRILLERLGVPNLAPGV